MALLPEEFSELEPFAAEWCLATEAERYAKRMSSEMDDMQALYDALVPVAEDAISFCDKFPLDDMPTEVLNLLYLLYSLLLVSFPVECWGQARVPDTGAAYLDCLVAPGP